jgi:hypothetical protein
MMMMMMMMMNVAFFYFNMRCKKNGVAGMFNGPERLHASSKKVNEYRKNYV